MCEAQGRNHEHNGAHSRLLRGMGLAAARQQTVRVEACARAGAS